MRSRKLAAGGVAFAAAAVLGTVLVMSSRPSAPSTKSAQHLMQSVAFHHAVRERVLLTASQNGQRDLDVNAVDQEISQTLIRVVDQLENHFPDVSKKLKGSDLPEEQANGLVALLQRSHDERLKTLGTEAIEIVVENAVWGPKAIREQLNKKLKPEMPQLLAMYKKIVPAPIRDARKKWALHEKKERMEAAAAGKESKEGSWEFLLHPSSLGIMKSFGFSGNHSSSTLQVESQLSPAVAPAARQLQATQQFAPAVKLGVGITGFVLLSVNTLIIELSQLLNFEMPWWGWLLTLLPGVSLGTTSCLISPIEKAYSDFWCIDFLMFTGLQALEVMVTGAIDDMTKDD